MLRSESVFENIKTTENVTNFGFISVVISITASDDDFVSLASPSLVMVL